MSDKRYPDHNPPHHSATRPGDVAAAWIAALFILISAALLIGPERLRDAPQVPKKLPLESVRGADDVLMGGHTFAPGAIAVHPDDRLVFWNVGKDLEALTLAGHQDILQQKLVDPGASFTFVIPPSLEPGTYHLICTTHHKMSMTLVVRPDRGVAAMGDSPGASFRSSRPRPSSDASAAIDTQRHRNATHLEKQARE